MNLNDEVRYQIGVTITGDKELQELNEKYRKKEGTTDVLSFEINKEVGDGEYYIGDVIVNREQAQRQAGENGNTLKEEIAELVKHGVLHLLGIHHNGDDH